MLNLIAVLAFTGVFLGLMGVFQVTRRRPVGADEAPPSPSPLTFFGRWEQVAAQAGLGWRRSTYVGVAGFGLALAALLAWSGRINLAAVVGLAGLVGPNWYVYRARAARVAMFVRQLPGALFLASSVLRAGGTLLQAVDSIASEMPDPVGGEFRRIQQQMRLHVPAQEAFAEAQARVGVREFAAVVVAARITAEVGGNLAHIFDQISRSIVEAQNARRTVQSFTTEGRMSANLIAALPFAVLGLLHLLSPGYFEPLFATWPGRFVLAACLGTILLGWTVIRRMVDIRMF